MDPVSLILGYGVYKLLTSKSPTPAAAAQTAAKVETLTDQLLAGQVSAVNGLKDELKSMVTALGLQVGGVGYPADVNGVTFTEYLKVGTSPFTDSEIATTSKLFQALSYSVARVTKDGTISIDEANSVAAAARELASSLQNLAVLYQDRTQKKT